jgi:tRNA threonylcarbamoyl adenosine modification protein YeaZ
MSVTLAIETSSIAFGIALSRDGEVLAERTLRRDDPSYDGLAPLVAATIDPVGGFDGVDVVAVDVGPGNLASVRSGVAYANGLAFSLGRPIFAASSLELLALESGASTVLCLRDAGAGRVYAALTHDGAVQLRHGPFEPVVLALASALPELAVAGVRRGDVVALLPGQAVKDTGIEAPSVSTLTRLAASGAAGRGLIEVARPLTEASPEFAA